MKAKEVILFDNISQREYNEVFYDFHNDYYCFNISFSQEKLMLKLLLRGVTENDQLVLVFRGVELEKFEIPNLGDVKGLTIDNLYRGRVVKEEELIEFKNEELGYFYLDFLEGVKFEFWCSNVELKPQ